MSIEVWNTVFAAATFAVIAATAIAALIQLRHMRAGNQLTTLLTLMQMWNDREMQEHLRYLRDTLPHKLRDPEVLAQYSGRLSRADHPYLLVADFFEQIGSYVKYGLMDERSWLDAAAPQIFEAWDSMEPAISKMRERSGNSVYENFEYVAVRARLWVQRYPDGTYPKHLPRMVAMKARSQ